MSEERDEMLAEAVTVLENEGYEARLYKGYSGRGMFGSTCTGVVIPADCDVAAVGWACGRVGMELGWVPGRTDSLGRQTIVY